MAELPSGTVTFLFTDVEGSTRLLKQLRDAYGQMLVDHRGILRAAFAEHGGQEIDTQGDAFFVAFRRARDAALAASAGQRGLAAHTWPEGVACTVRMGLHTGEPAVGEEGYHGLGVHRAARIMAAGHGGQVLLSQATTSVLEDDELPGLRLRDLGEHRLKDLDRPERIYQLDIDGLPTEFPPLRTADAPTAYSGREEELEEAARTVLWRDRFRTRRWLTAGLASLLVAAGAVALALVLFRGSTAHALAGVDANAVGFVNANRNGVVGQVAVGATPSHVAWGNGAVWVTNADSNDVSRIDPERGVVVDTIPVGSSPSGIATGGGYVWVANSLDGTVDRIDPATNTRTQRFRVGNGPVGLVYADGSLWVANTGDETIMQIDPDSGKKRTLPIAADELAFGAGTLWAADTNGGQVVRIDPRTGTPQRIPVGNGPTGIAFGDGAAWVVNTLAGTLARIDPETNVAAPIVPVGHGPVSVAVEPHGVWVANQFDDSLVRVDPRAPNRIVRKLDVGNRPQGVAAGNGTVFVAVRQSGVGHRGGTLVFRMNRSPGTLDTAQAWDSTSWTILRLTSDGLVGFDEVGGIQGLQLVPDLAVALPAASAGQRSYSFRLRPGIRYSNGRTVQASDFRSTLERDFRLGLPAPFYYDDIVGTARCERRPRDCDLAQGVVTDDAARTITFNLVKPDAEFLYKLALPFAYVVPPNAARRLVTTGGLPGTGPYRVAVVRPNHVVRLVRNPYFREWSRAAQPDGYPESIVFRIGGTADQGINAVLRGDADVFSTGQSQSPPSARLLSALTSRYASRVHVNPQPATIAFFVNTRVAPFDRLEVRRALNFAADRVAAGAALGGPTVAQPTCQILPPFYPGYQPYCPYTAAPTAQGRWTAPDLRKARDLIKRSGTLGMKVTFWSWSNLSGLGPYAARLLRSLGYRVKVEVHGDDLFGLVGDSRTKAQIGTNEWISDYPAASGFFNALFTCSAFLRASPANSNAAEFCNRGIDRMVDRATAAQATDPAAARRLWAQIDRRTVDESPWVPLVNPKIVDVLSKRVGNYQYSPDGLGVLIDQLWVR